MSVQMGQGASGAAAGAAMATTSVEIVVPEGCFAGSEITVEWGATDATHANGALKSQLRVQPGPWPLALPSTARNGSAAVGPRPAILHFNKCVALLPTVRKSLCSV